MKRITSRRNKRTGAALLSVMVMSFSALVLMLALSSILSSAARISSSNRVVESLRNAAEVGIDWAVDQYNSTLPCILEPPAGGSKTTALPSSELQAGMINGVLSDVGIPGVTVSVKVTKFDNTAQSDWNQLKTYSSIYSPQLDPSNAISKDWNNPLSTNLTAEGGGYRILESTATNGIASRTIRVILKARFDAPASGGLAALMTGQNAPTTNSYFSQPLFANTLLQFSGNVVVQDSSSPWASHSRTDKNNIPYGDYDLNVSTNQKVALSSGASIYGNVRVQSSMAGQNQVASINAATIEGRLLQNTGVLDPTIDAPTGQTPGGNVRATGDTAFNSGTAVNRAPLNDNFPADPNDSTLKQNAMAPTLGSTSAISVSSLSDSALQDTSSPTMDVQIPGLLLLATDSPVSLPNQSYRFFVQDSESANAVDINTSRLGTPHGASSGDFQIWYEGTKPVNVNVSSPSFTGLIYAPNAPVSISGTGNYTGGIVGKSVNINLTGKFLVDTNLSTANPNPAGYGGPSAGGPSYKAGTNGAVIQGWQPVTWQEF